MGKSPRSPRLFNGISWGVTILIVFALLGFGFWRLFPPSVSAAAPAGHSDRRKQPDCSSRRDQFQLRHGCAGALSGRSGSRRISLRKPLTRSANIPSSPGMPCSASPSSSISNRKPCCGPTMTSCRIVLTACGLGRCSKCRPWMVFITRSRRAIRSNRLRMSFLPMWKIC